MALPVPPMPSMLHQFLIPYNLYSQTAAHKRMMMAMAVLGAGVGARSGGDGNTD